MNTRKTTYKTNIKEVEKALELADDDKKMMIETNDKIVVIVEISKEKLKN